MQAERVSPAQQGAEHGHAERAAGLPGGVQDPAGTLLGSSSPVASTGSSRVCCR